MDLTGIVPTCLRPVSVRQRPSAARELVDLTGIEPVTS